MDLDSKRHRRTQGVFFWIKGFFCTNFVLSLLLAMYIMTPIESSPEKEPQIPPDDPLESVPETGHPEEFQTSDGEVSDVVESQPNLALKQDVESETGNNPEGSNESDDNENISEDRDASHTILNENVFDGEASEPSKLLSEDNTENVHVADSLSTPEIPESKTGDSYSKLEKEPKTESVSSSKESETSEDVPSPRSDEKAEIKHEEQIEVKPDESEKKDSVAEEGKKWADSKSILKELLDDVNGGTQPVAADSNVQEPRVTGSPAMTANGTKTGKNDTSKEEEEEDGRKEDIPTFSEWKQMQKDSNGAHSSGNQEHKNGNAKNGNNAHSGSSTSNAPQFSVQQFNQNFASADCGAKVLEASPKVQSRDAILQSDRDKYLNIPCDESNKYFVVELCEPIQLKLLDIGCFELFSSLIENFTVYASDRYPSRDWKCLGNFTAKNERSLQSFPISDPMYYKYIKIDYVSHYGKEHYCPVSNLRVFGLSIEVEDDEVGLMHGNSHDVNREPPEQAESAQQKVEPDSGSKNGNVLSTVTDAVAKIANKLIGGSRSDDKEEPDLNGNSTSKVNLTEELEEKDIAKEETHPKAPRLVSGSEFSSEELRNIDGSFAIDPPIIVGGVLDIPPVPGGSHSDSMKMFNFSSAYPPDLPTVPCDEDLSLFLICPLYQYMYALSGLNPKCCAAKPPFSLAANVSSDNLKENQSNSEEFREVAPEGSENVETPGPVVEETKKSDVDHQKGVPGGTGHEEALPVGSPAQKESLLMRLKNKVRELEFNMTLSSEYLEQLSRRYKKQMDDITAKHNKTLNALISTNEEAASRDDKHSQKILELEHELMKLTNRVLDMERSMLELADSLFTKHFVCLLIEFLIFALVIFMYIRLQFQKHRTSRPQDPNKAIGVNISKTKSRSNSTGGSRFAPKKKPRDVTEFSPSIEDLLIVPQATPFGTPFRKNGLKSQKSGSDSGSNTSSAAAKKKKSRRKASASMFEGIDLDGSGALTWGNRFNLSSKNTCRRTGSSSFAASKALSVI